MKNVKKNLPKATAEIAREYDELQQKLNAPEYSEKISELSERLCELENSYDWFNVEFTDPATGKKGLKTVSGEVIAPALYDGFNEYRSYTCSPHAPVIAIKDGKCGIVKGDGSGQQLCDFKFDSIRSHPGCTLYLACWDGEKERCGIIAADGRIVCPNILTGISVPFNGIMSIESGDKCGVIDIDTYQCVLPEYDDLEMDDEADIVFIKGGQRGYVTEDKGEFITEDQYENDDNYIDVPVFSTRIS